MLSLFGGSLGFATPWALAALVALPALFWLLRLLPPRPSLISFPNLLLLRDLEVTEQTPARLPWWILLLRMALAALLIIAASGPTLNPRAPLPGSGPIVMVVDNGWAAATAWNARITKIDALLNRSGIDDRDVILVETAAPANGDPVQVQGPYTANEARKRLAGLAPQPWRDDLPTAVTALTDWLAQNNQGGFPPTVYWLTDGLERITPDEQTALRQLANAGDVIMLRGSTRALPIIIRPPNRDNRLAGEMGSSVVLERALDDVDQPVRVQTLGGSDRLLGDQTVTLEAGTRDLAVTLDIPDELRSDIRQIRLLGNDHAASRVILDDRFVQRPVGLIAGGSNNDSQPLLDQLHYLRQAFAPFAELRQGDLDALLTQSLAVMVMADIGTLAPASIERLDQWVRAGGLLIRFAGPQLANGGDSLLPVRLRQGDRSLGGALSWTEPVPLADFPENSPFAGLTVPGDVTIERQLLAEPTLDLNERSWARLNDGTPLVTGEQRGQGYLVLFHTTASPSWSNLALSGLFVQMLERLMPLSVGVAPGETADADAPLNLPPISVLDGFGDAIEPGPMVQPLPLLAVDNTQIGPEHPPGLYGDAGTRRALNLSAQIPELLPLIDPPAGMRAAPLAATPQTSLLPWLLLAALILGLIDWVLAQWLSGGLTNNFMNRLPKLDAMATGPAMGLLALGAAVIMMLQPTQAWAQGSQTLDENRAMQLTAGTYLGYVLTGDAGVDDISEAGLEGLAAVLRRRTAAEVDGAVGVNITTDDLALVPLLYWPITQRQPDLAAETVERLNEYMRHGGMIIFDTRDKIDGGLEQAGPGVQRLRQITRDLDMPPLQPIGPEHVLTRAFYLLQIFPGRYAGGEVWVEQTDERRNDGVASVVIGAHDWASAWAVGADNRPMLPVVPGGERQRELAYRFGVNLVMYALTGNYKADQVHVPYILERLGQ
ncbi:MAG: DUF4159 domain-containing protein [Pseudomonadota bacterium]